MSGSPKLQQHTAKKGENPLSKRHLSVFKMLILLKSLNDNTEAQTSVQCFWKAVGEVMHNIFYWFNQPRAEPCASRVQPLLALHHLPCKLKILWASHQKGIQQSWVNSPITDNSQGILSTQCTARLQTVCKISMTRQMQRKMQRLI